MANTSAVKSTPKSASKKAVSEKKELVKAEVVEATIAAVEADSQAVEVVEEAEKADTFDDVIGTFADLIKAMRDVHAFAKTVNAENKKLIRTLEKGKGKRRTPATNPDGSKKVNVNGFAKPTRMSAALSSFLNLPEDELISRTTVTKLIGTYLKEHNLQNPEDKRLFIPDDKLRALLGEAVPLSKKGDPENKGYSYFNLQRYLAPHFPKAEPASAPVVTDA